MFLARYLCFPAPSLGPAPGFNFYLTAAVLICLQQPRPLICADIKFNGIIEVKST